MRSQDALTWEKAAPALPTALVTASSQVRTFSLALSAASSAVAKWAFIFSMPEMNSSILVLNLTTSSSMTVWSAIGHSEVVEESGLLHLGDVLLGSQTRESLGERR